MHSLSKTGGDDNLPPLADLHAGERFVPAPNNLARADPKAERTAPIAGAVKLLDGIESVQPTGIVRLDGLTGLGNGPGALLGNLVLEAGFGGFKVGVIAVVGQGRLDTSGHGDGCGGGGGRGSAGLEEGTAAGGERTGRVGGGTGNTDKAEGDQRELHDLELAKIRKWFDTLPPRWRRYRKWLIGAAVTTYEVSANFIS